MRPNMILKFRLSLAAMLVASAALLVSCGGGDTSGGDDVRNNAGLGQQYVADGGAGSRLSITVSDALTVGGTVGFTVTALDASGEPLKFVRIFCDSEKGIAIVEPSSGGQGYENTNASGVMSGVLGGLLPGSFLLECRAPEGFGLVARKSLRITGTVPDGFPGFPGAAGGNLGGGVIVDDTDNDGTDGGIRVSAVTYTDAGGENVSGPIDTVQNSNCDGDSSTVDPEPFTDTAFKISVENDTTQRISVDSVTFEILNSAGASVTVFDALPTAVEIDSGGSGDQTGLIITFTGGLAQVYNDGSSTAVSNGTFTVNITIAGEKEDGSSFTAEKSTSLTLRPVDNCG